MGLSNYIKKVIEQNRKSILSDVPFQDILIHSNSVQILTTDEVKRLKRCDDHKNAGFEYLEILNSRDDNDFYKFCEILKENESKHIQNIGVQLENAAIQKKEAQG